MSKDMLKAAMLHWQLEEACNLLDAKKVPQRGRMVWDGRKMHCGTEMEASAQSAFLDVMVYGTGLWQQEPVKASHIDASTIYKPQTPAEVDAYVESLIDDDIETHLRGTWRLRPLAAAIRGIWL